MNKVTFPLKKADKSSEVASLQDALKLMLEREAIYPDNPRSRAALLVKLSSERQTQTYDACTFKAVTQFQSERQLRPDGTVGRQTAAAINSVLKEWGVFDEPNEPNEPETPVYQVQGRVLRADGTPLPGTLVRAFDKDLRHEQFLGETSTDHLSHYSISYTQSQFRRAEKHNADLIVRIYSAEKILLAESDIIFNAQPEQLVDLVLHVAVHVAR